MNAAARLVHQHTLSRHLVLTHLLTRWQALTLFFALAVIVSALSIVYVTHTHRMMYAEYQRALTDHDRLKAMRGQLLLEQSTQFMQARIQQIAEKKLAMMVPDQHTTIIVRE